MPDRPRCVAADADPEVNRYVATILERAGLAVRRFAGPWEVAAADLTGTALVVLGGRGSGVTAVEVARSLRAAGGPPVVVLTNGSDRAAVALAAADPAVRTVAKPFTPDDLGAAVAALAGQA